jgi:hypothetical protein
VGDTLWLWRHREVLQGRPKKCRGGKSATMMCSYPFTLARRAVVATMDLTAKNLHLLKTNHWLKSPRNVCCLSLTGPAWDHTDGPAEQPPSRREALGALTVEEVVSFLESQDAAGLGGVVRLNAVNGRDWLQMTDWQEVVGELNMSKFAAKKFLSLRDLFLAA